MTEKKLISQGTSGITGTTTATSPPAPYHREEEDHGRRIAALEARIATLEGWIATLRKMGATSPSAPRGCVCPVGAEAVCRAAMCHRRPWVVT